MRRRFADLAERVSDHVVNTLAKCRAELTRTSSLAWREAKGESVIFCAAVLVDPDGEVAADYQKVHLKGEQRLTFRPGYRYVAAETRLGVLGVLVGWDWPSRRRRVAWRWTALSCCASAAVGRRPTLTSGAATPLPAPTRTPCSWPPAIVWAKSRPIRSLATA